MSDQCPADIIYIWRETAADKSPSTWKLPPQLRDPDGRRMWDPENPNHPILDFPHLPLRISTNSPWHYFEAYFRADKRVTWNDIRARMLPGNRGNITQYTNHGVRSRPVWNMVSWKEKGRWSLEKYQQEVKNGVRTNLPDQVRTTNSTRGYTPGLVNPALPPTAPNNLIVPSKKVNDTYQPQRRWTLKGKREAEGNDADDVPAKPSRKKRMTAAERERAAAGITQQGNTASSQGGSSQPSAFVQGHSAIGNAGGNVHIQQTNGPSQGAASLRRKRSSEDESAQDDDDGSKRHKVRFQLPTFAQEQR